MMARLSLLVALLCCLWAPASSYSQAPGCPEIDRLTMARALGIPDLAGFVSVETARCSGLQMEAGRIGFRLSDTTLPVHGGIRSEVAVDYPYREGETVRYAWEMLFPGPFAGDAPLKRWWLVAQWHDQPDRRIGEKWDGFPPRSPPVAIYVEERDGEPGIGLIMNGNDKRSWTRLPRDTWLQVSVTMRWSTRDDGNVTLDVADRPEFFVSVAGQNMHKGFQHYLKLGQYRHPQIKTDNTVFFRKMNITKKNRLLPLTRSTPHLKRVQALQTVATRRAPA